MTRRKNRKRLARERAERTGESYLTALQVIRARAKESAVTIPADRAQPTETGRGAFLVAAGLLTEESLEAALDEERRTLKSLGRVVLDRKLVDEASLMAAIAFEIGVEFVDLDDHPIDSRAAALIPATVARRYTALPIGWDEGSLMVAMADPGDLAAIDHIRTVTGADVKPILATREAIVAASTLGDVRRE